MVRNRVGLLVASLTLGACSSGDPVSIGDDHPGKSSYALEDYAASWDGYVEAYNFPSGSDRVRLTLDENGDGYLQLGDQPLAPPATDGNVVYGPPYNTRERFGISLTHEEHFRYPVHGTRLSENRIELGFDLNEPFKAWCELQTPVLWGQQYACAANWGLTSNDAGELVCYSGTDAATPIDCGKATLCRPDRPCHCTAEGCGVVVTTSLTDLTHRLDAALEDGGASLEGTILLDTVPPDGTAPRRVNVRFDRH
jgi:hypothetical protein